MTAAQMLSRKSLMFPRKETKLKANCCSDSVLVCGDEFSNIASIVFAIFGTSSGESASTATVPI